MTIRKEGSPDKASSSAQSENWSHRAFLPFSDLDYRLIETSPVIKTLNAFKQNGRLKYVRALSFLSRAGPTPDSIYFESYEHSRGDHREGVGGTFIAIAGNNNLPQEKMLIGTVAALIHDDGTPALGDATKSLDQSSLNEEDFWYESLGEDERKFLRENNLSIIDINAIIHNEGVLGQILDIADRVTYTMQDVYHTLKDIGDTTTTNQPLAQLNHTLARFPDIGNIYKDVRIDSQTNSVHFTDSHKLGGFLLLRALMHKHLYMNPISQGRDMLVADLIRPIYSVDMARQLNPQLLRQMTDLDLLNDLSDYHDLPRRDGEWIQKLFSNWAPQYTSCLTEEEAREKSEEIGKNFLVLGIKDCGGFDAGLSYLTLDVNGQIVPFYKADPKEAERIRRIQEETKAVYVYYTDASEDTPINKLLRRVYWQLSNVSRHPYIRNG